MANSEQPIIEIRNLTKQFILQRRHYGLKNIVLHLPQYIKDMREAHVFTALRAYSEEGC